MTALKRLTVSYNELTRLDDVSHMVRLRSNQSEFLYQFCCGLTKFFDPKKDEVFPVFFMAFLCVVVIVEVLEIIPCSCFADIFGVS